MRSDDIRFSPINEDKATLSREDNSLGKW